MAGPIKRALVEMGYRVREYCPVGELLPGMSYLVRRLLENTSNEGFLRAKFSDNVSAAQLAARSERTGHDNGVWPRSRESTGCIELFLPNGATPGHPARDTYENAPLVNFVHRQTRNKCGPRLREVRGRLGQKYPLVIDGQKIWTGKLIASINPSSPKQVVGCRGGSRNSGSGSARSRPRAKHSTIGVASASSTARELLERVATIMDRRRFELSALEVFEVGKPWAEADGDIREAIDFLPLLRAADALASAARD